MAKANPLPTREYLQECFAYDSLTGVVQWRVRPRHHFRSDHDFRAWNTRFSGKVATRTDRKGHLRIALDYRSYGAHRVIWRLMTGEQPSDQIDHRNHDPSDNRWNNLRPATQPENQGNSFVRPNNKLGVKGVFQDRRRGSGRFYAQISKNGRSVHLGTFATIEEAKAAYDKAALEYFGEFARS